MAPFETGCKSTIPVVTSTRVAGLPPCCRVVTENWSASHRNDTCGGDHLEIVARHHRKGGRFQRWPSFILTDCVVGAIGSSIGSEGADHRADRECFRFRFPCHWLAQHCADAPLLIETSLPSANERCHNQTHGQEGLVGCRVKNGELLDTSRKVACKHSHTSRVLLVARTA